MGEGETCPQEADTTAHSLSSFCSHFRHPVCVLCWQLFISSISIKAPVRYSLSSFEFSRSGSGFELKKKQREEIFFPPENLIEQEERERTPGERWLQQKLRRRSLLFVTWTSVAPNILSELAKEILFLSFVSLCAFLFFSY